MNNNKKTTEETWLKLSERNPKTQIYSHVPNGGTLETLKVDFDLLLQPQTTNARLASLIIY